MSKVFDTTNYIDTSQHLKSKLNKNFLSDNYWIESYQNKINKSWQFATDVADIEESIETFDKHNVLNPIFQYRQIEVRIMSVHDPKGLKLSDDFKKIVYQDSNHPLRLGQKYKFDLRNFANPTEINKSVWLNVNFDKLIMGSSAILRRCNGTLGFLVDNKTQEWYEPAIIENEFSYTNNDFNSVVKMAQDELYVTVQSNKYTNDINISDRFIIGALDFDDITKNTSYKVKAVHRIGTDSTFKTNEISLIKLVLGLDTINPQTDLVTIDDNGTPHYIADYYIQKEQSGNNNESDPDENISTDNYYLQITPVVDMIPEGESQNFECFLKKDQETVETLLTFKFDLPLTDKEELYYSAIVNDNNHFTVHNLHKYFKSDLIVTITAPAEYQIKPLIFEVQLGERL